MAGAESPIFVRSYELLRWLIPLTLKFPRQQRFVLAAAIQQSALRLHERLIVAGNCSPALLVDRLNDAQVDLDILRHYLRLCHDLDLLTTGQYEHGAMGVTEIGRLLGGWRKSVAPTQK